MVRSYVYMEISEYPSPGPWAYTPSSALCSVFVDFPLGGIMTVWTTFLTQLTNDILIVTWLVKWVLRSFNKRFVRCICIRYIFVLSVIHPLYISYSYGRDHKYRFFHPIITRIMDSFSCSLLNTSFYIGKGFQKNLNTLKCDIGDLILTFQWRHGSTCDQRVAVRFLPFPWAGTGISHG